MDTSGPIATEHRRGRDGLSDQPAAGATARRLTWSEVTAFRLSRHHLLRRAPKRDLVKVVRDMVGVQAQVIPAARLSLWARVEGLESEDVDRALWEERSLVKANSMRRTLFLLPSQELAIYVRGSARRAEKEIRWMRGKGVPSDALENLLRVVLNSLDAPITRPELAARVSRELGGGVQLRHGGGWGSRRSVPWVRIDSLQVPADYLLHLAGARGVVCSGPRDGNESTFVRADAWVRGWHDLPAKEAEAELLRRYLRAFAPANPEDFALWSGIRRTDAVDTWRRLEPEMAPVRVDSWNSWILRRDLIEVENQNSRPNTVRLLPHFDSYLLAHRDRGHLVSRAFHPKVFRPQGWIYPTVVIDGRVAGNWGQESGGGNLVVRLEPFDARWRRKLRLIRNEAASLARFLGYVGSTVRVVGVTSPVSGPI